MREKIFRWLFKKEYAEMQDMSLGLKNKAADYKTQMDLENRIDDLEDELAQRPSMTDLMRESIGLPYIDFSNVDEKGNPPSYFSGMTDEERKNFVACMETIYVDPKFQSVVSYVINRIGNHAIQVFDDDKMRNGRYAIIGVKTLLSEFEKAHNEHLESSKKVDEEFDPLEPMPN